MDNENPGMGHNSDTPTSEIASDRLVSLIERIEVMNAEKKEIASAISDIFAEAKGAGFDVKTMREILKLRAMDEDERQEREHYRDLYLKAMGIY
jgi:uncharacterized protein (UPF0335 family)